MIPEVSPPAGTSLSDFKMQLRFWGVRGSIPTPSPRNAGYGGNTACLGVTLPSDEIFIFDGGTGIRDLGLCLAQMQKSDLAINLFLTHFHWDHVQGIPFFTPLYAAKNKIAFHSTYAQETLKEFLGGQMSTPYFPVHFELLAAQMDFVDTGYDPGNYGSLTLQAFPLNHPQGASGYRMTSGGKVIVYASDHEHGNQPFDRVVREFAEGADVLVYDTQFTPDDYPTHRGWGHSTWLEGTRIAKDAGVKQLVLFHHDPARTDDELSRIVDDARREFENTDAAREGWIINL